MIDRQVFAFLKNVFLFLIDRLYKEWKFIHQGNDHSYSKEASERGDLYAKHLVENIIRDHVRNSDPYVVDGISVISFGTITVVQRQAYVIGLSTLHMTNTCCLKDMGNRVFINGAFGAGPLTYESKITFKFGNFKRKVNVLVSLMDIEVSVDFSMEKETGRDGFLQNLSINKLNGFNLRLNGFSYFDWILNLILNFLTFVLGRIIRNLLENKLEQYILNTLPKYQFPVEGISFRKSLKFNIPLENVKNNDALSSETFYMKQSGDISKWPTTSPITQKNLFENGYKSMEYEIRRDLKSDIEKEKTSKSFLQTNKCATEQNNFHLTEQNLGLLGMENQIRVKNSKFLIENPCTVIFSGDQGVEMPENRCLSCIDDSFESQTSLKSDIFSDSMKKIINENLDSETQTFSVNIENNAKQKDGEKDKVSFNWGVGNIEDESNEDSLLKREKSYTPRNSKKLNKSNFQNIDTEHNDLLETIKCLLEECTDCVVKLSSIAGLKSITELSRNSMAENENLKALNILLQETIISKTLKLKLNTLLESDLEIHNYSDSFPLFVSCKNY